MISLNISGFACSYNPESISNLTRDKGGKRQYGNNRSRRSRFYNIITCLHYHRPIKTFWTFTVPNLQSNYPVTDKDYTYKFKRLCEYLRLRYNRGLDNGLENFVWVSEAQKRGNIHFHLVTSTQYMDVSWVNNYWCLLIGQESNNAVDVEYIQSQYIDKNTGEIVDNSIRNISGYFAKYLSKKHKENDPNNMKGRIIHARSFGYSRNFPIMEKISIHESDFFRMFPDVERIEKEVSDGVTVSYFFVPTDESYSIVSGSGSE